MLTNLAMILSERLGFTDTSPSSSESAASESPKSRRMSTTATTTPSSASSHTRRTSLLNNSSALRRSSISANCGSSLVSRRSSLSSSSGSSSSSRSYSSSSCFSASCNSLHWSTALVLIVTGLVSSAASSFVAHDRPGLCVRQFGCKSDFIGMQLMVRRDYWNFAIWKPVVCQLKQDKMRLPLVRYDGPKQRIGSSSRDSLNIDCITPDWAGNSPDFLTGYLPVLARFALLKKNTLLPRLWGCFSECLTFIPKELIRKIQSKNSPQMPIIKHVSKNIRWETGIAWVCTMIQSSTSMAG